MINTKDVERNMFELMLIICLLRSIKAFHKYEKCAGQQRFDYFIKSQHCFKFNHSFPDI